MPLRLKGQEGGGVHGLNFVGGDVVGFHQRSERCGVIQSAASKAVCQGTGGALGVRVKHMNFATEARRRRKGHADQLAAAEEADLCRGEGPGHEALRDRC